tara:strand:- start:472 stop:648 length:177 start_codon:yes stop_codon:yes gene_type:complete
MPKFTGINRAYSADKGERSPAEKQRELDDMMKKFLEKGGKVQKVPSRITKDMLKKGRL